jgi:hypothetical protein
MQIPLPVAFTISGFLTEMIAAVCDVHLNAEHCQTTVVQVKNKTFIKQW